MIDPMPGIPQPTTAYANTPVERHAARLSLAAACIRTQASPQDLRDALEAAGLLE